MTKPIQSDVAHAEAEAEIFHTVIETAKQQYPTSAEIMDTQPCFIEGWYLEESGVCDQTDCYIRIPCQTGYTEAQARIAARRQVNLLHTAPEIKPMLHLPIMQAQQSSPLKSLADKEERRKLSKQLRSKWKNTGKYQRTTYAPCNRPVDWALSHLIKAMDTPKRLGGHWSSYRSQEIVKAGRLVLAQTSNYTVVLGDGHAVLRFWTATASSALIDVVPSLVSLIKIMPEIDSLQKVTPGSAKKLAPCTHRFKLVFGASTYEEVFNKIGLAIKNTYGK